jgi:hypothetical protein
MLIDDCVLPLQLMVGVLNVLFADANGLKIVVPAIIASSTGTTAMVRHRTFESYFIEVSPLGKAGSPAG